MNKQKYLMTSGAGTHTLLSKMQRQHPWVTERRGFECFREEEKTG